MEKKPDQSIEIINILLLKNLSLYLNACIVKFRRDVFVLILNI